MTRFPQKGYAYASKESALSQRQAESPSDSEDSDVPQSTSVPGKQLRMPTPSKQASASSDDDDSDDYVSVSSSDDEDDDENVDKTSNQTPQYPILGARARKRIRPPTTYAKQMAVYIRVCLLHLRDSTKVELSDAEYAAYQEALREHRVERVIIPEKAAVEEAPVERKKKSHKTAPAESSPPAPVLVKVEKPPKKDKPKPIKTEEAKQQQPSSTTTPPAVTGATVTTTSSHNHTADDKTDTMSPADKSPVKRSAPQTSTPEEAPPKKIKVVPSAFQIPANANPKEMDRVRHQASQLQKEGIALKHDGDKKGKMDVAAQGVCYLRASAKFLEQALLLSDLKAMYKALNDSVTASKWGKDSISTLAQTANLVESTVGFFNKSGERRRVALSYKVGAIVMLASYRLQHNMLYGYYSQLHAPGRSPDGTGSSDANQDPMIQRLILKEMGALMRGFEFWRRYEACGMQDVLPDIRDPSTVDMPTFFAALEAELS